MAGNDNGNIIGDLIESANANQSKVVDTTSPYYLHPSDHPSLIFVTQPLSESGDNYFTWRRSFMNALHSKNKASFVDGTIGKSEIDSLNLQSWIPCNAVVLSWVTDALAKELQGSTAHVETAREIWTDLEDRFTQGITPRVYDLKRAIAPARKSSISSYYGNPSGNMASSNFSSKAADQCVIDTGATNHITHNIESLSNMASGLNISPIQIPNGDTVAVHALGWVALGKRLTLEQVLGVPEFHFNLLSVSKLTRDLNYALTFLSGFCVIQDLPSRMLIGVGKEWNGLYYLEPMKGEKALTSSNLVDANLWHRRLGHYQ
ncbi:hypothetical protein RJ639_032277 [Escallonia herrerae]|uniref:Retrotransposon Copia-like N-terminal domain-containing protein n=1 Tax=Escallonia herrerae TaxID=1293975 RepID=A0AA88WWR4_9ASTE|nr:hypothetical protein RJ639_032277 [Escallonia herrerae]